LDCTSYEESTLVSIKHHELRANEDMSDILVISSLDKDVTLILDKQDDMMSSGNKYDCNSKANSVLQLLSRRPNIKCIQYGANKDTKNKHLINIRDKQDKLVLGGTMDNCDNKTYSMLELERRQAAIKHTEDTDDDMNCNSITSFLNKNMIRHHVWIRIIANGFAKIINNANFCPAIKAVLCNIWKI